MNLLIFIDWFTPGYKAGGPVRSNVNIVSHFFNVFNTSLVCSDTDYCEKEPYPEITSNVWLKRYGINIFYLRHACNLLTRLKIIFREASCHKDYTWYINGMYSFVFSIFPLILARIIHPRKVVIAPRGMLSPQAFKNKGWRKKVSFQILRFFGCYNDVVFHTTSDIETEHVRLHFGKKVKIVQIANLPSNEVTTQTRHDKITGKVCLIAATRISPEKNTLFALQCLAQCHEEIQYDIYGQIYDQQYWQDCLKIIHQMPQNVIVHYHGPIPPHELSVKLLDADFFFLPTRGENFGNAIWESFQAGIPVIISDKTPWRNLEAKKAGWDLPLDSTGAFARVIDMAARLSSQEYEILVQGAKQLVQEQLDVDALIGKYTDMFKLE